MYVLTAFGKTRMPLAGVPWRDLSDREFADARRKHPGIEDQGYFEHLTAAELEERNAAIPPEAENDDEEPPANPPADEEVTNDG